MAALLPVRDPGTTTVGDGAPPDMLERIARGRLTSPLPYAVLDDYDRADRRLEVPAIELDNGEIRAVVLPGLGGRVWSLSTLVDGEPARELVHTNPRLRWANFGLTDAWFAGGIEWNLGSTGHAAMGNRPMHAAILDTSLGPVVRLWEWERTRDLVLQVDLWLSGPRLMASTRVVNPDPEPKPLYYWTNIAVPETTGTRVLSPARTAWRTDYSGSLTRVPVPFPDGPVDVSVPRMSPYAADYFYEVAHLRGRSVSAVEPDGHGLGQTSTDALRGRKLFLWGHGPGGQRWQDWLGVPGSRYLEIQAGVCPTQLEHDLLGGGETRSWTEAFVPLALDPADITSDYDSAAATAQTAIHAIAAPGWVEQQHARWLADVADLAPGDLMHTGSGWGRAELALRGADDPAGTAFPEVEDDSAPLLRLARDGDASALDEIDPDRPTLPLVSDRWVATLSEVADARQSWWASYALATAAHLSGDLEGARTAYGRSLEARETFVALRGLAHLTEDATVRVDLLRRALELAPDERRLAVELLVALRDAGRHEDVVATVADLTEPVRSHGRTRLLHAEALAAVGETGAAAAILDDLEVPDLAEGDRSLSDLWERVHPGEPVPARLDFRMVPDTGA